jgi:hypothetical protein
VVAVAAVEGTEVVAVAATDMAGVGVADMSAGKHLKFQLSSVGDLCTSSWLHALHRKTIARSFHSYVALGHGSAKGRRSVLAFGAPGLVFSGYPWSDVMWRHDQCLPTAVDAPLGSWADGYSACLWCLQFTAVPGNWFSNVVVRSLLANMPLHCCSA